MFVNLKLFEFKLKFSLFVQKIMNINYALYFRFMMFFNLKLFKFKKNLVDLSKMNLEYKLFSYIKKPTVQDLDGAVKRRLLSLFPV